jgi:hypothetical protein
VVAIRGMFFQVFLPALLWGLCVLAALAGWGRLLTGLVRRHPGPASALPDWLDAPAWGIAITSLLAGILNLASLATRTGLVVYVLVGLVLFISSVMRAFPHLRIFLVSLPGAGRPWLALLIFVSLLLALRFASSVIVTSFHTDPHFATVRFNPQDDQQSYLVSVTRLLQTGSLGLDPFNSRLMMTGFGGQSVLNALVVAFLPLDHLHLLEGGIALAALCLASVSLGLRLGLGRLAATALALVPLAVECSYINITSLVTSAAVLTVLVSSLLPQPTATNSTPVEKFSSCLSSLLFPGLLLGGACALKSTTIPVAVLFIALFAMFKAIATRRLQPLLDAFIIGLIAVVSLLPWMLWQFRSSGTALYPLLGQGFHWEAFFPSPPRPYSTMTWDALSDGLTLPLVLMFCALPLLFSRRIRTAAGADFSLAALAFLLAWTITWPIIAISTENPAMARYLAAPREVALLFFLALAWKLGQGLALKFRWLGPAVLLVMLAFLEPEWSVTYAKILPRDLATSGQGRLQSLPSEVNEARALQAAVAPGEKILVYLSAPYLLDFQRNPVFVADWPGESSPPPGLPVRSGPGPVADYLRDQDIRYVAYAYAAEAGFRRSEHPDYLYFDYGHVIHRTTVNAFAFQKDLAELAHAHPAVFDDGQVFVLNLASDRPTLSPAQ